MTKGKRRMALSKLVKVFIAGIGILVILGSLYKHVIESSADNTIYANVMASSRFATSSESSAAVVAVESEVIEETVAIETETQEVIQKPKVTEMPRPTRKPNKAKKTNSIQKQKTKYISIEEYKEKMNSDMDISHPSGLSKKTFVELVSTMEYDYTDVFKRNAELIWSLTQEYNFDEIAFLGIIAQESKWGSSELAIKTNNYTSQMNEQKS